MSINIWLEIKIENENVKSLHSPTTTDAKSRQYLQSSLVWGELKINQIQRRIVSSKPNKLETKDRTDYI